MIVLAIGIFLLLLIGLVMTGHSILQWLYKRTGTRAVFLKKSGLGQKMLDKRMETMTPLKASGSDSLNRTADLDQTDDRMVKKRYRYDGESSISDSSSSSDEIPSSVRRKEKERKEDRKSVV